jgi:hypothetical protein
MQYMYTQTGRKYRKTEIERKTQSYSRCRQLQEAAVDTSIRATLVELRVTEVLG